MEDKKTLRQQLRKQRSQLSPLQQQQKSEKIISHILKFKLFETAQHIGFYHAVRGEADPSKLSLHTLKKFYLPIVIRTSQELLFAPTSSTGQYQNNTFNIPEPICNPNNRVKAEKLDLLIMPLLGFDKNGNRLGMGGGFYDRTLSYKQQSKTKPVLMGFAYDFQEVATLQAEPWDIRLDWIATESKIIACK